MGLGEVPAMVAQSKPDDPIFYLRDLGDAQGQEEQGEKVLAAPAVRRLARDMGVDLSQLTGTGIGGRITAHDVKAASGTRLAADTRSITDTRSTADTRSAARPSAAQ